MDAKYERAVAKWLVANMGQTALEVDGIHNIRFEMASSGVCETCYTEFAAIVYDYSYSRTIKNGKRKGEVVTETAKDMIYSYYDLKAGEFVEQVVALLEP